MNDYAIPAPDYTASGDHSVNRIQNFQLVKANPIRAAHHRTTPAWELTFKIPSGLKFPPDILGKGVIAAGMQIALLPVNNAERVQKTLDALSDVPAGRTNMRLPKRDGVASADQPLTAAQAIAHTVDLTRPTKELLKLVNLADSRDKGYDFMPVEEFLQLPGVKGRISFQQLLDNQLPLANRKYTPSRVDAAKGEISILLSEEHAQVPIANGSGVLHARGTGSGYLADMAPLASASQPPIIQGFLDLRKHKLPYDYSKPMILLSTGVGVAPHLAMLREAKQLGRHPDVRLMLNGIRYPQDELLGDEIRQLLKTVAPHKNPMPNADLPPMTSPYEVVVSDKPGQPKNYLQHTLTSDQRFSERIWRSMRDGRDDVIYICGRKGMEDGVLQALVTIGADHGIDGEAWVKKLLADGRIKDSTSEPDRLRKKWDEAHAKAEATAKR